MLQNAEFEDVSVEASANFSSRDGETVESVIIHITDGQEKLERSVKHLQKTKSDYELEAQNLEEKGDVAGAAKARKKSPVSAHFLVGRDGEIIQLVSVDKSAWHASGVNKKTIGIEHIARTPQEWSVTDPGMPVTVAQYQASAKLVKQICKRFNLKINQGVTIKPHCDVEGTTHHDCGRDITNKGIWDWQYYMGLLTVESEAETFPAKQTSTDS